MTRAEALEVYKLEHVRYDKWREVQWKLNVSIWTLIALGIYQAEKLKGLYLILISIGALLILLSHFLFLYLSVLSLEKSKRISDDIEKKLNENKDGKPKPTIEYSRHESTEGNRISGRAWAWIFAQVLPTVVLLLILVCLLVPIKGCAIVCQ